jgi:hypothetical protein
MADQKSRGGKKAAHEKQPGGKKHQGTHDQADRGTMTMRREGARRGGARR